MSQGAMFQPAAWVGGIVLVWICVYSRFLSLADAGSPLQLGLFLIPLLVVHRLVCLEKKAGSLLSSHSPQLVWALVSMSCIMAVSAAIHDLPIMGLMRQLLWLWAACVVWIVGSWNAILVQKMCRYAAGMYFIWILYVVSHPTPPGSPRFWYPYLDNTNLMAFHFVGLSLLSCMHGFNQGKNRIGLIIAVVSVLTYFRAMTGIVSYVLGLIFVSPWRRLLLILGPIVIIVLFLFKMNISVHALPLRLTIWTEALSQVLNSPWFGLGPGQPFLVSTRNNLVLNHVHNVPLQIMCDAGLLGLFGLTFVGWHVKRIFKTLAPHAQHLIICFGVWGMVDDPFVWYGSMTLFAIACTQRNGSEDLQEKNKEA